MNALLPLMRQLPSSSTAVVRVPPASLPAPASVRPNAPSASPEVSIGSQVGLLLLGAEAVDRHGAERDARLERDGDALVDAGELLEREAQREVVAAHAAVLLGERQAEQAHLGHARARPRTGTSWPCRARTRPARRPRARTPPPSCAGSACSSVRRVSRDIRSPGRGARAVTVREGLGRPSCPAIQALVRTSASRSTPVSMPRPCSCQTRSSVARLPVALPAYGQPPRPPALASTVVTPALQRDERVGQRLAVGVVEVHGERRRRAAPRSSSSSQQVAHLAGRADADRVAERDLACSPSRAAAPRRRRPAPSRHVALPRVAEAHGHVAADGQPLGAGARHDRARTCRATPATRAVEVALREGLGGAGEHGDLADARRRARGRGPGRSGRAPGGGRAASPSSAQQLLGVGELRHPPRRDEAGQLDGAQPGVEQPPDELRLDLDRDDRRLVLQAVARDRPRRPRRAPAGRAGRCSRLPPRRPRWRAAGRRRPGRRCAPSGRSPSRRTAPRGRAPSSSPPPRAGPHPPPPRSPSATRTASTAPGHRAADVAVVRAAPRARGAAAAARSTGVASAPSTCSQVVAPSGATSTRRRAPVDGQQQPVGGAHRAGGRGGSPSPTRTRAAGARCR